MRGRDAMEGLHRQEEGFTLFAPRDSIFSNACDDVGHDGIHLHDATKDDYPLEDVNDVVAEVLRVNPTVEAAEQSWLASMELYPQVTAMNDPAFRFMNGPTIFGSAQGQHLWRVQVAQRVPWYGKRGLMGEIADQQADVAFYNWRRVRHQLAGNASSTYAQYVLAERVYELSLLDSQIAEKLSSPPKIDLVSTNAQALYQYDSFRIDQLELQRKREDAEETRDLARERLNVMLKRDLSAPLPDPRMPELPRDYPNENAMISRAMANSPDLAAAKRMEQQAASRVALAEKDFYPDIDVVGRFDTVANDFWAPDRANIRPQLGIYLPLPVQQRRRWARLRETKFEHRRRQAESNAIASKLKSDIQRAIAQLNRSQQRLASLDRLLAAAERRVQSQEVLVSNDSSRETESLVAKRNLVKYQIEHAKEQTALHDRFVEISVLTGTILHESAEDLAEMGTDLPSFPLPPDLQNDQPLIPLEMPSDPLSL